MTTWTPDTSTSIGDFTAFGGTLYVLSDYVVRGYFTEEFAAATWTEEANALTTWTPA